MDAEFDDLAMVAFMFSAAMIGPEKMVYALRGQLESLCFGYLEREDTIVLAPPTTLV